MYRIIQWGTGNVGKHALRTIVERPDFELVGLRVYNPDKVGKDAGDLLGARRLASSPPTTSTRSSRSMPTASATPRSGRRSTTGRRRSTTSAASSRRARTSCPARSSTTPTPTRPRAAGAGENAYERLAAACERGRVDVLPRRHQPGLRHGLLADQRCRGSAAASTAHRHRDRRHDALHVDPHGPRRDRLRRAAESAGAGRRSQSATCTSPPSTSRCGSWPTPSASSSTRSATAARSPSPTRRSTIAAGTIEAGRSRP